MPENGKEYPMEVVERAEDAYCVDGLTFDQAATMTGVSASTLKRWSASYGWPEKRENIRRCRSAIRTNRVLLHAKLIKNCLNTLAAKDAFAVAAIEGVVQRAAKAAASGQAREARPENMRRIETESDAVAALEEAVEIKINRLLSNPDGLNFGAMQDVSKALELLGKLRGKSESAKAPAGKTGLSATGAEEIRKKILGIK